MDIKLTALGLLIVLFTAGCTSETEPEMTQSHQAVTALGDTLYAPPLEPDTEQQFQLNLDRARSKYELNPDDPENIIWYGRRMAYLGDYRRAIEIFSEGIEKHPYDARMYRHRGHRYITVREFDNALSDFQKAVKLIEGTEDQVEPDGLPNEQNEPRSTLHTNIWYHYGLAKYLTRDFPGAADAFRNCLVASDNDDMLVASSYWLYMSLRWAGQDGVAGDVLEPISEEMNIIENDSYHKLLLVFNGSFNEKTVLESTSGSLENATIGYGLGNWHYINGRVERAENIWQDVYNGENWAAFGYIASEVELAEM